MTFDIYDTNEQEYIDRDVPAQAITDVLVNAFCAFSDETLDVCRELGRAFNRNEDTSAYEAYLGVSIR